MRELIKLRKAEGSGLTRRGGGRARIRTLEEHREFEKGPQDSFHTQSASLISGSVLSLSLVGKEMV